MVFFSKESGFDEEVKTVPEEWFNLDEKMLKYGRVPPLVPAYRAIESTALAVPVDKAMYGGPDVDVENELHICARRANLLLRGTPSREERQQVRAFAYLPSIVGLCVIAAFFIVIHRIFTAKNDRRVKTSAGVFMPRGMRRREMRRQFHAWLFLLPAVLSILVWAYVPLCRGLGMAFQDYRLVAQSDYVGVQNFMDIFADPMTLRVLLNTIYYVGLTLALGFFTPVILALLLTEIPKGKVLFRTLYYLPAVIAPVIILIMWKQTFFEPTEEGVLNVVLGWFGMGPQGWLQDPRWAMLCIVVPAVWAAAGPGSLIYIAALKSVSEEAYEAADLDGASSLRKMWHLTFPQLKALLIINFVGAFVGSFKAAENILVLTGGGPANATRTIGLEIFYNAFVYLKFGYATAMAWVMGFMLVGFTLWQLRVLRRVEFTRAR